MFKPILISIVMPVFNTGQYLRETLQSVFMQKFRDFELICIDDASSDVLTENILQSFQNKYNNMRIIRLKKNVGAAQARNIGFSMVRGKYVIFLDADDIFASDLFEKMYQCTIDNNADVCICGYEEFYMDNGKKKYGYRYVPDVEKIHQKNGEMWLLDMGMVPWNKLCKVQFLREKNIYFQSLSSCNDMFFSCMVRIHGTNSCCVKETPMILYRTKTDTQISANRDPINLYRAMMLLKKVEQERVGINILLQWIGAFLLWPGVSELRRCQNEIKNKRYYHLVDRFFKKYPIRFQDEMLNIYMDNFKRLPFESLWFLENNDEVFLRQLRLAAKELKKILYEKKLLFLWGSGKRGKAFQHFCNEQNINLQGVADIKNLNIGSLTEYGNKIISTQDILEKCGLVIASNHNIYEYLNDNYIDMEILNLEEYCPGIIFDSSLK